MSRIFKDFPEARNEIKRDLAELGIKVQPETMQDKQVADDPDFLTRELTNYAYTITKPDYTEVEGVHEAWVAQEWNDRVIGDLNPGRAWRERHEVWDQFIEKARHTRPGSLVGSFSYTYSQRMGGRHIDNLIEELQLHPHSRQLWLPVWWPIDESRRGKRRVPCSLGYWLVNRKGKLHMTYMMRSCDFFTHWANDVALATMLQFYIAQKVDLDVGTFHQFIGSFHVYAKDVADVF